MKRRRLTISCTHPASRARWLRRPLAPIPMLRLHGRWLQRAGFPIGAHVVVAIVAGEITLRVQSHEQRR